MMKNLTNQLFGSKGNIILIPSVIILLLIAVHSGFAQEPVNKYSDPIIRQIHDLADHRDSLALLPFLRDSNPNYRGEALMCLGSLQACSIIDSIAPALESDLDGIRMAAAFALGQTYNSRAVNFITEVLEKDTVKLVRGMLFDALGKTGDSSDLQWIAGIEGDYQEAEGQAQGIVRFAIRGITSEEGNNRILKILKNGTSTVGLIYASYHIGRYADKEWLSDNVEALERIYRSEVDPVIGANLLSGIIKGRGNDAGSAIETILKSDADYREKVNTIKAVNGETWDDVSKLIYKMIESEESNIVVAAAESIVKNAGDQDQNIILKLAKKTRNWRARALLLGKTLELSGKEKVTADIENQIKEVIRRSQNVIEKAWLLKCFTSKPENFSFVEQHLSSNQIPIRTYAMETLTLMAKHENFKTSRDKLALEGVDLDAEFFRIFREAIISQDIAQVSMAATVFRDPGQSYKTKISDVGFLEEALEEAQSPELIEAKNELSSTISYLTGKQIEKKSLPVFNHPIDWEKVISIPPKQLVGIATSKGEIIVQMNVNWCPGTVSAFLELAESGFYNNKVIHRVVPNFVVQDGCPRGDGWGGPPFTIRSEFTPSPFMEGTLGMASAGKDTEGSQWYFTHTATPHLDGKYTNFGIVVSGIEIVHKLEVGDVIEEVVVIRE